jgi:RimJ/RimL family protein N-acetyltransferase
MWPERIAPRLEGRTVVLEPLGLEHEEALFAAARPVEIWEWWPFNPAVDRSSFHRWLCGALDEVAAGGQARFATLDAAGRPIGSTSFCTLRPEHRGLEIGWTWLTPAAWGTATNVEAKLLQLRYAFEELGCQRVEFETDERNERSRRALAALPACFEGVLRDYKLVRGGTRRSSAVYSILDDEWPGVERNLKARIARHQRQPARNRPHHPHRPLPHRAPRRPTRPRRLPPAQHDAGRRGLTRFSARTLYRPPN